MPAYRDIEPIEPPPPGAPRFAASAGIAETPDLCRPPGFIAGLTRHYTAANLARRFSEAADPAVYAARPYALKINLNNVRNVDAAGSVRIKSYAGPVIPHGLEYGLGVFSWWLYRVTGKVAIWTVGGDPDYWIQPASWSSMQGTYRDRVGSSIHRMHPGPWAFDHWLMILAHETGHYFGNPGTNRDATGHSTDPRSIVGGAGMVYRRILDATWAHGSWGLLPGELAAWRSVVNGR